MMCNASISQNKFPQGQKSAIVRPLLKKTTLDPSDLNSFRPISNLNFVSKLLERIINIRFTQHADQYNLFSPVQSAYRKFHSTETALVKIHNDLITTVDEGRVGALALLDLSAAFDTVNHQMLLEILRHRFCVTDSALALFASYLSDRSQVSTSIAHHQTSSTWTVVYHKARSWAQRPSSPIPKTLTTSLISTMFNTTNTNTNTNTNKKL